jgi:hypothetical protein
MALSNVQLRQLRAKLDSRHVKTRQANGTHLHYVEGWHVISEANRIFGYDAWDRRTVATKCVSSSGNGQRHFAAYTAKVRITVRAGDITIVREGSGTGEGSGATTGQAHEIALKSAETDATKRRSPPSATRSGLHCMIASNLASASVGTSGMLPPLSHGCFARKLVTNAQASISPVSLPPAFVQP